MKLAPSISGARWQVWGACLAASALVLVSVFTIDSSSTDHPLAAKVVRGDLAIHLVETGVLKPAESITYRSPLAGREAEITFLAPEGIQVNQGDLLVRIDTTELAAQDARARQALRQAELELQLAEADQQEARGNLESISGEEGAFTLEEARLALEAADHRTARLRSTHTDLTSLLSHGYITNDELQQSSLELEQAEAALRLAQRKFALLTGSTRPRERQKAAVELARREARVGDAQQTVVEARARISEVAEAIRACAIYARQPGLIVYEDNFTASPARKIHVGDRVTASQGLITIPSLARMRAETSIRETDLARVRAGLPAVVKVDALSGRELRARVFAVGALARASVDRAFGDKRFDLGLEILETVPELRPEMTVQVDVHIGQRRDVLMAPVNAVFDHGGVFVSYVVTPHGNEPRRVDVGESNSLFVEIKSGLRAGESLRLNDALPSAFR